MARHRPTFEEFADRARAGFGLVPVHRRLLADRVTPVTAFEALGGGAHAFLLESVVGGERVGRHSFLAARPSAVYAVRDGRAEVTRGEVVERFETGDPLADLKKLLGDVRAWRDSELPSFGGGLVGYAGYDLARYYEREKLGSGPPDDRALPDAQFGLYDELTVFDHVDKTLRVVANVRVGADLRASYDDACRRVDEIVERLQRPSALALVEVEAGQPLASEANVSRERYEANVARAVEYIRAGDVFQVVPSVRMRARSAAAPLDVYRALRVVNPSPFMFLLKSPACTLIGSSPEILCRVADGEVTTRPLAGTRRRGRTGQEDLELEAELRADPKELAEHVMLVDLHRNDVGRVCVPGSVRVAERMAVERYSHVMHLSSDVRGTLAPGFDAFDALRVSLPVGTVSGAPKVRAMQVIDELEPTRRGPYGGAVGYVDFAGNMDTCIALRTVVWAGGAYDVQCGAGVVADSVPRAEHDECMAKAGALLRAIELAESWR